MDVIMKKTFILMFIFFLGLVVGCGKSDKVKEKEMVSIVSNIETAFNAKNVKGVMENFDAQFKDDKGNDFIKVFKMLEEEFSSDEPGRVSLTAEDISVGADLGKSPVTVRAVFYKGDEETIYIFRTDFIDNKGEWKVLRASW